uniref:Uncharacterized protein n=1 Tax=Apteryx owenii TaxID=8824 RepID=A0A8B9PCD1_APTOW
LHRAWKTPQPRSHRQQGHVCQQDKSPQHATMFLPWPFHSHQLQLPDRYPRGALAQDCPVR